MKRRTTYSVRRTLGEDSGLSVASGKKLFSTSHEPLATSPLFPLDLSRRADHA
jgi:hypothetical protein